jgi:hypothetical protein
MPQDSLRYAEILPITTTRLTLVANSLTLASDLPPHTPKPHGILKPKPGFVDRIVQVLLPSLATRPKTLPGLVASLRVG